MADESIIRMNLSAIKKIDPYAKEIVNSSSHVAFYTFNSKHNEWEKTDVEGAFFIYHRNAEPFYSIFINNRLNTTSFVEPITGSLELQSQPPFLLYRNERSRIRGFWFYNSEECDRISSLINGLLHMPDINGQNQKLGNSYQPKKNVSNANIFNMLSKAQQEYNAQANFQHLSSAPENVTPGNVLKFFESAKQATAEVPFNRIQPLSVDQLEKQQRAITPINGKMHSARDVNVDRTLECRLSPFHQAAVSVSNITMSAGKPFSLLNEPNGEKTILKPPKSSISPYFANDEAEQCLRKLLVGEQYTDVKPALMPPTMFDSPKPNSEINAINSHKRSETLNSTQFVQAFTYLIENDTEFVDKLHKAYLKICSNTNAAYQ